VAGRTPRDRPPGPDPIIGAPPGARDRPLAAIQMKIQSKLPSVGTTIFTVMSALAEKHSAINLGQGFPDFDCDRRLVDAVGRAMIAGHNQYPPMAGVLALREAIVAKIHRIHGVSYDPASEVTVTAGATQALLTALLAVVRAGDEVIVIEPVYDSYQPGIELAGGRAVPVPMTADYRIDWSRVEAAVSPATRAIMVNSPHNPTGTVLGAEDVAQLAALAERHDLVVISDEVYEHMVFDGGAHRSLSAHPSLRERSFVISSFGKTFHVTGWKVGYCVAPPPLMAEFRKVHQFNVFTVNSPMQVGLAAYLEDPEPYLGLADFYQARRDRFLAGLESTALRARRCEGTYFVVCDYSGISDMGDADFCRWLTEHIGVAAVPMSAFRSDGLDERRIRFCFAKREETLDAAVARLARLGDAR
jgi:methionine aminotransferase